jgi:hypothetical protein
MHWACESTEWISAKTTAGKPERAIAISAKTIAIKSGHVIAVFQQKTMAVSDICKRRDGRLHAQNNDAPN